MHWPHLEDTVTYFLYAMAAAPCHTSTLETCCGLLCSVTLVVWFTSARSPPPLGTQSSFGQDVWVVFRLHASSDAYLLY
jgi:hypothetical protein